MLPSAEIQYEQKLQQQKEEPKKPFTTPIIEAIRAKYALKAKAQKQRNAKRLAAQRKRIKENGKTAKPGGAKQKVCRVRKRTKGNDDQPDTEAKPDGRNSGAVWKAKTSKTTNHPEQ